jgi:hypothetical protein
MTKQGSLIDGASESGSDTIADGSALVLGEEAGKEAGIDWRKEIATLKGRQYGSIDDAIGDVADMVIKKLKLSGSGEVKSHLMESLLDDEGLCEIISRELVRG